MLSKKQVLKSINKMPDKFPVGDAIEALVILDKIQKGSQEIKEGRSMSTQQAKKMLKKWLK